ncbi:MAG: hypothetical protein JWN46_2345 [Acidimicrobiales bacterium]|nr:hypothetical protein [Acidimicrobiales bacterium]
MVNDASAGGPDTWAVPVALHPRHGPHDPVGSTPPRRPRSLRRTTTVDSTRPDGISGPMVQVSQGRDLLTEADGSAVVIATARATTTIHYTDGPIVQQIVTDPGVEGLDALVGRRASAGFRGALEASVACEPGSLVHLLLDEVPAATLVSGYALGHAAQRGDLDMARMSVRGSGPTLQIADLCAGFVTDGTMMREIGKTGRPPAATGPPAPEIADATDPQGWHDIAPLPPDATRRRRRIDVTKDDGQIHLDVHFRDSHMAPGGLETVIHEYKVSAAVDPSSWTFTACSAQAAVLPWWECPGAVASAGRLIGQPVGGLRTWVRAELVGPPTCTHLNDTLRGLEDVPFLVDALRGT